MFVVCQIWPTDRKKIKFWLKDRDEKLHDFVLIFHHFCLTFLIFWYLIYFLQYIEVQVTTCTFVYQVLCGAWCNTTQQLSWFLQCKDLDRNIKRTYCNPFFFSKNWFISAILFIVENECRNKRMRNWPYHVHFCAISYCTLVLPVERTFLRTQLRNRQHPFLKSWMIKTNRNYSRPFDSFRLLYCAVMQFGRIDVWLCDIQYWKSSLFVRDLCSYIMPVIICWRYVLQYILYKCCLYRNCLSLR